MVDTAVRPRPDFSVFLRSDVNAGGDGLSYFDYKRLLRSQKVARLQQKQALTRVPGYKFVPPPTNKVVTLPPTATSPVLQQKDPVTVAQHATTIERSTQTNTQENEEHSEPKQVVIPPPATNLTARPETAVQSTKPPRQIKSATIRSITPKLTNSVEERPKTAAPVVTKGGTGSLWKVQTAAIHHIDNTSSSTASTEQEQPVTSSPPAQSAIVDGLIHSFRWSTSTQRGYNEVGWENKLQNTTSLFSPPHVSSFHSSVQTLPDPVSLRFTNRRNELLPAQWQSLGNAWDGIQTRKTFHSNGVFCSPFKNTFQLPGYLGNVSGEPDRTDGDFMTTSIATRQPRPTTISRRPNIPGYSGCTHWSSSMPALTRLPYPNAYTTDYRSIPVDTSLSPFIRTSPLSKMITLVSPFNPFNKIED